MPWSTGSLKLDLALGGGLARGCLVVVSGAESSGKTGLCLSLLAALQRQNGICAWIDAERSLNAAYAVRQYPDLAALWVAQPASSVQAIEITEDLIDAGELAAVVVDSLNASLPVDPENEAAPGLSAGGMDAYLVRLRRLIQRLRQTQTTLLCTYHTAFQVGAVYHRLKYKSFSLALRLLADIWVELGNPPSGNLKNESGILRLCITKNKYLPVSYTINVNIMYNVREDKPGEIFDLGHQLGVITREGAVYRFGNVQLGERVEAVREYLQKRPELSSWIEQVIRQKVLPPG